MKTYLTLVLVLGSPQTATAGMYKCINIDEKISYSDKPCVAAKSLPFNLTYFSSQQLNIEKFNSPKQSTSDRTPKRQKLHPYLNEQESQILKQINRREKKRETLEQWKEKQRYKSALKEAARQKKQHKLNLKKCNKYKERLKNIQEKARSGYRASEWNRINSTISRNKKYINKFCG